jgi:hypothetical protein
LFRSFNLCSPTPFANKGIPSPNTMGIIVMINSSIRLCFKNSFAISAPPTSHASLSNFFTNSLTSSFTKVTLFFLAFGFLENTKTGLPL